MKIYRAIDLFAGIGGIRLGFEQAFNDQIEFIFSNDINPFSCQTYEENFGKLHKFHKVDIKKIKFQKIPKFDILLAGFPCQAFSLAGKKNGFKDERGNLFFCISDIINLKRPFAFLLENVKNLKHHKKGETFRIIMEILEEKLGYFIHHKILNAVDYGLPQNRERLYIIGFREDIKFKFPSARNKKVFIDKIINSNRVDIKYYLSQQYLNTLKNHKNRHKAKGNGFGYQVIDSKGIANTLVCGGMGKERNLIKDEIFYDSWQEGDDPFKKKNSEGIRKMTEREWARLQGFPDTYKFPVSMTQAYKQLANSVPVPVIKRIALEMKKSLDNYFNSDFKLKNSITPQNYFKIELSE